MCISILYNICCDTVIFWLESHGFTCFSKRPGKPKIPTFLSFSPEAALKGLWKLNLGGTRWWKVVTYILQRSGWENCTPCGSVIIASICCHYCWEVFSYTQPIKVEFAGFSLSECGCSTLQACHNNINLDVTLRQPKLCLHHLLVFMPQVADRNFYLKINPLFFYLIMHLHLICFPFDILICWQVMNESYFC